jgi:hypothetical protein
MKKLVILAVLAMIFASFTAADVNFEKLKAAHIVAMKYHGHATLAVERDASMIFMSMDKGVASVCYGKEMASAYMEKGNSKFYWTVEKNTVWCFDHQQSERKRRQIFPYTRSKHQ